MTFALDQPVLFVWTLPDGNTDVAATVRHLPGQMPFGSSLPLYDMIMSCDMHAWLYLAFTRKR